MKTLKIIGRIFTGLVFIGSGILHFASPASFQKIVPPVLPAPLEIVYISGVFELLGGLGLLVPKTQRAAGYGLAALLAAVYPANLYHAFAGVKLGGFFDHPLYHWLRLPLQFVFIWFVLWCTQAGKTPLERPKINDLVTKN